MSIINSLINKKKVSFVLDKDNKSVIKLRCEYKYKNKDINIFIYLNEWDQFIKLYNLVPCNQRHFYEII